VLVGANLTETEQDAPAASVLEQVVPAKEKSAPVTEAALGTVTVKLPMPVLVNVAPLVVELPTGVTAKVGVLSEELAA
jgi:hypothetical protein